MLLFFIPVFLFPCCLPSATHYYIFSSSDQLHRWFLSSYHFSSPPVLPKWNTKPCNIWIWMGWKLSRTSSPTPILSSFCFKLIKTLKFCNKQRVFLRLVKKRTLLLPIASTTPTGTKGNKFSQEKGRKWDYPCPDPQHEPISGGFPHPHPIPSTSCTWKNIPLSWLLKQKLKGGENPFQTFGRYFIFLSQTSLYLFNFVTAKFPSHFKILLFFNYFNTFKTS